ncbi:MAG: flavoprotein [Ktedonobacteraceae bacterium]|nr:flavoprotein [Ktedonobacteraceae bacterium]
MAVSKKKQPSFGILYVVVTGAYPAIKVHEFIKLAQEVGWSVCTIASPQATRFINTSQIERITKRPIRSEYKQPGTSDMFPKADAVIAIPTSFNTVNKWATGIADTLATSILCEYLGKGTPIGAVLWPGTDLGKHPAYAKNRSLLKEYGVEILFEPESYSFEQNFPWKEALSNFQRFIEQRMNSSNLGENNAIAVSIKQPA